MNGNHKRFAAASGGIRRPVLALALVALVALLTACSGTQSTTTQTGGGATTTSTGAVTAGGTLRVGMQAAVNLDPAFSTSQADILLNQQLYDYLVAVDAQNQVAPALATTWDSSADGLTWTFELQPGVTFSNGKPLTAADVVYTFNRLRDPKVGASTVSLYKPVKEVSAPDATHVKFVLSAPNPEFPADVGGLSRRHPLQGRA